MKSFLLFVIALAIFSSTVIGKKHEGDKVGVKVTVSEQGLIYLKKQMMIPYLEKTALSSEIPEMTEKVSVPAVGNVDITLKNIKINRFVVNNTYIDLESGDRIGVKFSGLNMDVTLDWHYREERWPHVKDTGKGEAQTRASAGVVDVFVSADKNGRPTAKFDGCSLNLHDLKIHLQGGASWLYNAVISIFHKKIDAALQNAICGAIYGDVQQKIDELLSNIPVQEPIGNYFALDYSLAGPHAIRISPDRYLVASSSGEFFPIGGKPGNAPGTPVQMPDTVTNTEFQVFFSEFSAESLGYAAVQEGLPQKVVTKDMVPSMAAYFFTSAFYGDYAPGILDKYGEGKDVALYLNMHETPDLVFNTVDEIYGTGNVDVTIRVMNDAGEFEDAFTLCLHCVVDAEVSVNSTRIFGHLADASASATLVSSNVGDVNVIGFNDLIQFALALGLDSINDMLLKGAPLPAMPGLDFVNPTILYRDGYIIVATNITYTPPSN